MKIYWMFLILSLFICLISNKSYRVVAINGYTEKRGKLSYAILFFGVVIFFCGLRSGIADTGTYIFMFDSWPENIAQINWSKAFNDKGFFLFSVLYKQFISTDYHGWLFLIALISGCAIMNAFLKFSSDFGMSCFLFIATTTFTYLINGMRQFIVIAILLSSLDLIIERKPIKYIILVLLLSTIHLSAILLLPFYFVCRIKPWSKQMWSIVISICLIGIFFNKLTFIFKAFTEDSHYEGYIDLLSSGTGVNIFRILIAMVPILIAFIGRQYIRSINSPIINISIVMSMISVSLYVVALFTNGMVMGRLLSYFEIYNLILLPWLINNCFEETSSKIVKIGCFVFYTLFFVIQMQLTWNIGYVSDILNLKL